MIDKVFPRKLNSSKDARVRGKDEMIDAVNVTIDDNYDDAKNDGGSGNFGVLKPVKGNVPVGSNTDFTGNGRVIGSCVDDRNNKIYYFLFSSVDSEQGIYEYSDSSNNIVPLITSKYFNFIPSSVVQADVVHIPTGDDSIGSFIFFTDGYNEPRKIDVSRASDGQGLSDANNLDFFDFISVCTRTPVDPPVASFQNDPNSKVSNFRGEKGFQFAYQNIYKSGDVSALSTYSRLYVPSAYLNQGTAPNPSFFSENYLAVVIPQDSVGYEVDRVRVLVREGNLGNWFIVDEVENTDPAVDISLSFYNDSILTILPEAESRRQFNGAPKSALSQTITNNRLFFGNYKEGFTVPKVDANITAEYLARPQDFIVFDLTLSPEIRNLNQNSGVSIQNKTAAYRLDTSNIPVSTPSNTQIIFNISLSPDKNFHFYEARKGYHGTMENDILGIDGSTTHEQTQVAGQQVSTDFNNLGSSYFSPSQSQFSITTVAGQSPATRSTISHNPYTNDYLTWEPEFTDDPVDELGSAAFNVACGTNAANPFIIQGKPLQFSGSFVTRVELSRANISDIIADMMIGNYGRDSSLFLSSTDAAGNAVSIPTVDIISANNESQYTINLQINNLEKLSVKGVTDPRAKMVNAVGKRSELGGDSASKWVPPCGFFIVNYAKPRFRMRDLSLQYAIESYGNADDHFFAIDLVDLGNFDTMTCVPDVWLGGSEDIFLPDESDLFEGWVCMTASYIKYQLRDISQTALDDLFVHNAVNIKQIIDSGTSGAAIYDVGTQFILPGALSYYGQIPPVKQDIVDKQISRWLGSVGPAGAERVQVSLPDGTTEIIFQGGRLINTFTNFAQDAEFFDGVDIYENRNSFFSYGFTLVDGDGGAGGIDSAGTVDFQNNSSVGYWSIVAGVAPWFDPTADATYSEAADKKSVLAAYNNMPRISQTGPLVLASYSDFGAAEAGNASKVEIADFETIYLSQDQGESASRSFKRKATHSFGIVFYDQRGRASDVAPIGSAYVEDYMSSPQQGPVEMLIDLTAANPPSWAWHYQIVYGGNSTIGDFIQYSAGGAFVEYDPEDENDDGNIYVSLNYLQNNRNVSYSDAFGVTRYDGNKDFYTYKEGDKLRLISYYTDNESVAYPPNYEFDVVGTVTLADDDDNPLINPDEEAPKAATGQFVILRNNRSATGFNYQSIKAGSADGPAIETKSHYWNDRCIFELYSPLKNQEIENRVYYEISNKYNVIRDSVTQEFTWENAAIRLSRGDVYFRRVAVNIPRYDSDEGLFKNIITDNDNNSPRFLDYFLETQTFTDSIIGANQLDWGKPKIINTYQREVIRDSSITFSDVNDYSLPTLRYSLFDPTTTNYKDLPNSHGSIQRLVDRGDSVFVVQEEKSSDIPVSRTLLSDSLGSDIVVASEKVLGNQVFYSGDYGCSDNPESVVKVGDNIYFANKDKREVYKFNPSNGVAIISEYGMKSYFKTLFDEALANEATLGKPRVVGGYDPLLDEFIITVYNQTPLNFTGENTLDQDAGVPAGDFDPADYAGITQEELDALEAANILLATELAAAQADINDLQAQIAALYAQIGDVVNDPPGGGGPNDTDLYDIIADLQAEIDEANAAIDANYGFMQAQIQNSVDSHRALKIAADQEVANSGSFITQINSAVNAEGVNRYANELYQIPPTIESQFTSPFTVNAGDEVDYTVYLQVLGAIREKLKEYQVSTVAPGKYDETVGTFTDRQGNPVTFPIGYGIPTDDSLSDEDANSVLPIGSALYDDEDFMAKALGITGPSGTTYIGYLQQSQSMIQFFGISALEDLGTRNDELRDENNQLEQDKLELLAQIAGIVTGVYDARGPLLDKPDLTPDEINENYPFGISYIDSAGNTGSPFGALKAAVDADGEAGDSTYPNLRTELESNPITQQFIIDAIEEGILGYRGDFQTSYDGSLAEIDVITTTRDALATTAYGGILNVYNSAKIINNGVAPTPKPSGNTLGSNPIEFFTLLANGTATPQQIIAALSGQTLDADGNLVSNAVSIDTDAGDIEVQFSDYFAQLQEIYDVYTGSDATVITGEGLTPELKSAIFNALSGIEQQIADAQALSFAFPTLTFVNDETANAEAEINAWASAILGVSPSAENSLQSQLEQLKLLIYEAVEPLVINNFFNPADYSAGPLDVLASAIALPVPSANSQVDKLYQLLGEVNNAITSLKDFQILFGSGEMPGTPYIETGAAFPSLTISEQGTTYGVGYTGTGGAGLTALKLAKGQNVDGPLGYPISTYVGLQNALDFIAARTDQFAANQTGQTGELFSGSSYATTLSQFNGSPFFFNSGTAADILSTSQYNAVYNYINSLIENTPIPTENTGPVVAQVLNAFGNDLINELYDNLPSITINQSLSGITGGLNLESQADLDGDGSVGVSDLLEFLTFFGSQTPDPILNSSATESYFSTVYNKLYPSSGGDEFVSPLFENLKQRIVDIASLYDPEFTAASLNQNSVNNLQDYLDAYGYFPVDQL